MSNLLETKYIMGEKKIIAYLDLCGTKDIYDNFDLPQQVKRITIVLSNILGEIDNVFGDNKKNIYLHMYADSLVIAEKEEKVLQNYLKNILSFLLRVQYQILIDSEDLTNSTAPDDKTDYMPILSRSIIKRGNYFGILANPSSDINDLFSNFSIVGGSTIVEMDNMLNGLPFGTFIEKTLLEELNIDKKRTIEVTNENLYFIKPENDFDFLRELFSNSSFDNWCKDMINKSGSSIFKSKLKSWVDIIQGRQLNIEKSKHEMERNAE